MAKDNFFSKDRKMYDLRHNREFLSWYKNKMRHGYNSIFNVNDLERLIDFISMWYYIKYPDRYYEIEDGKVDLDFSNTKDISNSMDFNEMLYRLPKSIIGLIMGIYRSNYSGSIPIYDSNGNLTRYEGIVGVEIIKNNQIDGEGLSRIILEARSSDGLVNTSDIKKNFPMLKLTNVNLDLLLDELKELKGFELTHLMQIIFNHTTDIELRNRLIYYISLKILYNDYSTPYNNYRRSKAFNKEIKDNLLIKLDESYLDELMQAELEKQSIKIKK